MQLEESYFVEVTKLMDCVDNKDNPIIQIVITHQHNTISAMLHTVRSLKRQLHRGKRQIYTITAQKIRQGKRMHGQFHVT
jgi:hypothetical protein